MNILIVDDDDEIRFVAAYMLRDAGHEIREAGSGASAAHAVEDDVPDVVLMDLVLGDEDGIEVAGRLQEIGGDVIRVIFLTGATRPEQVERLQSARACGVIQKPFDPAALPGQVLHILEASR